MLDRRSLLVAVVTLICVSTGSLASPYSYPRLALQTDRIECWYTSFPGNPQWEFLSLFDEIYTSSDARWVEAFKIEAAAAGYGEWVQRVVFLHKLHIASAQELTAPPTSSDYRAAQRRPAALLSVGVWHNLAATPPCDWRLHAQYGASAVPMYIWGVCNYRNVLLNNSDWSPLGVWDGTAPGFPPFPSTQGLTVTDWLCLILEEFRSSGSFKPAGPFSGLYVDDAPGRNSPCWGGYVPPNCTFHCPPWPRYLSGPETSPSDCGYVQCYTGYAADTWNRLDQLFTDGLQPYRDAGHQLMQNGVFSLRHYLEDPPVCALDDVVFETFTGAKLERVGTATSGWPGSDYPTWFDAYVATETYHDPAGTHQDLGWDVTVINSIPSVEMPTEDRERVTRLNLGIALMGDGYFDGCACDQDEAFNAYLTDPELNAQFAPFLIEEMGFEFESSGEHFGQFSRPGQSPVYYRHFIRKDPGPGGARYACTVAINLHDMTLYGVPSEDAQWFRGYHTKFPVSASFLIFNHWRAQHPAMTAGSHPTDATPPGECALTIEFSTIDAGPAAVAVYDISGRVVRHLSAGERNSGRRTLTWDGRSDNGKKVPSGTYFWRSVGSAGGASGRLVLVD